MNKTEQAVKDIVTKYSWDAQRCTDKLINSGLLNSQPLNLDVKVDDNWVEVKEPEGYQKWLTSIHDGWSEFAHIKFESYQQAKTVREKIAELKEENENLTKLIWMPHNELQQENEKLREERDELKSELIKEAAMGLRRLDINVKLEKQLQAEKSKTKELVIKAYLDGFKSSGEGWNGEYPHEGTPDEEIKSKIGASLYYESLTINKQ